MTESEPVVQVVDVENDGFTSAVRAAVHPIVVGLGVLILVVSLAGAIAIWALAVQSGDIKQSNRSIVSSRTESRHTQCLRENNTRHDAAEAARNKALDLIRVSEATSGTKVPKSTVDLFVNGQVAAALASYPRRDCSAKGIEAFYTNPPTPIDDGPCVPDGKGLCRP